MSDSISSPYHHLKELIEARTHNELACREYLQYAKHTLVKETPLQFIFCDEERRGSLGDSDYIISCRVSDKTGHESIKAYLWELKAPQSYIFEKEKNKNRVPPSQDLIQAENQLFSYHFENQGNDLTLNYFHILHRENFLIGGIIIGCNETKVRGDLNQIEKDRLYGNALMIRNKYIYKQNDITLITWDYILDILKPKEDLVKEEVELADMRAEKLDPEKIKSNFSVIADKNQSG